MPTALRSSHPRNRSTPRRPGYSPSADEASPLSRQRRTAVPGNQLPALSARSPSARVAVAAACRSSDAAEVVAGGERYCARARPVVDVVVVVRWFLGCCECVPVSVSPVPALRAHSATHKDRDGSCL